MNLSTTSQATLLLTSYFSKAGKGDAKPLTNSEWGRFALWLKEKSLTPADLLVADPGALLVGWSDTKISLERLLSLLSRGHSLALAVEKWQRAGLWVLTRSDSDYPKRLKARLKTNSPPVLFGCGNQSLLNHGGVAVVGSRNACDADLEFSRQLGAKAAGQQIGIVSGGARGVDEAAMLGAIQAGGHVIGIMADSLLKAATSVKWRQGLMDGHVVLVSPFYPEAGFNAGNAMARNKYIYCLADTSVVVHSGTKGGTLNGAEENLKNAWVSLWVKPTQDQSSANEMLVTKGGRWCEADVSHLDISHLLLEPLETKACDTAQADLFSSEQTDGDFNNIQTENHKTNGAQVPAENAVLKTSSANFYRLFIRELSQLAAAPVDADELPEKMGLHQSQVSSWLEQALDDGYVQKLNRPVRYQYIKH